MPFLEGYSLWRKENTSGPLLSINTWRPEVVEQVLPHGGHILNDMSGLPDNRNARCCAETGAALLIMHSVGAPKEPHRHVAYENIMASMLDFFRHKIHLASDAGLSPDQLLLDPGIDFAKQRDDNLRVYADLALLQEFQRPILLPVSRKSVIKHVLGIQNPVDRDAATQACIVAGMRRGANVFRVHNVRAASETIRTLDVVLEHRLEG
jgi:dihydropteroate synthase